MDITWLLCGLFHAMAHTMTREEYELAINTLIQFAGHSQTTPPETAIFRQLAEMASNGLEKRPDLAVCASSQLRQ